MLNITDDYDTFNNCTQSVDNENNVINIILKLLLLLMPSGLLLISLISLIIYTTLKPLLTNKWTNFYTQPILLDFIIQDHLNAENRIF